MAGKYVDLWNKKAPDELVKSTFDNFSNIELGSEVYKHIIRKIEKVNHLRISENVTYGDLWLAIQGLKLQPVDLNNKVDSVLESLRKSVEE